MSGPQQPAGAGRFGLALAPGGLSLVQELLNTRALGADWPDQLADRQAATSALDKALDHWAEQTGLERPRLQLTDAGMARLRRLRDDIHAGLSDDTHRLKAPPITFSLDMQGREVRYAAGERGAEAVTALVQIALLLGAESGQLHRLKTCANTGCAATFYDESKNSSRVWHDVRTCGNSANLRSSRARRRMVPGSEPDQDG